jgi:hypothetical protein
MANITMNAADSMSAKLASCYVKINGKRYLLMQMIDATFTFAKNKSKVPILGRTGQGNKATGWAGTFSAKLHYNTSIFRKMMIEYKNTGKDVYFETEVVNDDPTSAAGRQSVVFTGCNLDSVIMAKFDAANDNYLDEDISGTYEDCEMPEEFTMLAGME